MYPPIKKGSTDVTIDLFIQDSSSATGDGLTGLVFNSSGLVCYYRRGATGSATALTLATQTVGGAHSDGGFVEISSANMPGVYRLDLSDAICATGVDVVTVMLKGAANMAPLVIRIPLEAIDRQDTVRLGLTALPSVAIGSAGGLLFAYTGSGTGGVSTSLGMASADVVAISGDVVAAINAESFFDGTGYAGTNNVIPSVTTVTGNVNGSVGSVTGAVGSVTGNVGGSVASVVGSVGGNVLGSVGSLATQAKADVNAEVDTAIADARLDELLTADSDIDGLAPPAVGSVIHEMLSKTAGSFTFDQTTDSLEAIRDNTPGAAPTAAAVADAVWDEASADHVAAGSTGERVERLDIIASGGSGGLTNARAALLDNLDAAVSTRSSHSAADVWTSGTRTLTSFGTLVADIWAAATSGLTTVGSIGKRLVDYLTGDIFARLGAPAGASVSADIAAVKSDTAAILVDTGTTLDAAIAVIDGNVDSILADTGTDGVVVAAASKTGYELSATGNNAAADALLARAVSNVEATADLHSVASGVLKLTGRVAISGSNLVTYRTNGTTTHMTQAITEDATQDPISQLGDPS